MSLFPQTAGSFGWNVEEKKNQQNRKKVKGFPLLKTVSGVHCVPLASTQYEFAPCDARWGYCLHRTDPQQSGWLLCNSLEVLRKKQIIRIAVLNTVFKNGIRKLSRFLFLLIPTNISRASCQLNLCAKLKKHGILKAALSRSKTK